MSDRLKVLTIPSWYPSAAQPTAGVFILEQVRALASRTASAVLYVDSASQAFPPSLTDENGAKVVRAGVEPSSPYARFFQYRRVGLDAFAILRESWGTPDIVHVQALWPAGLIARSINRRYGIPYVVTEHSEEYLAESHRRLTKSPLVVRLLLRPLARGASRTIAVSRFLADRLVDLRLAVNPLVIPNVVSDCTPAPMPSGAPKIINHVSVMGPAKNLESLLNAVYALRARRSDFRLRLVGDGECRIALQQMADSLDLGETVEFAGRQSSAEVRRLIGDSAFTVVSSTHETFSVSAAESLMCGRPVLSTRCGGPEEFITPEVGHLVDANDVDALAVGLDWMLDHFVDYDPEALHRYALARFGPDVIAEKMISVYRSVLDV